MRAIKMFMVELNEKLVLNGVRGAERIDRTIFLQRKQYPQCAR
jgi:hypothetical protein